MVLYYHQCGLLAKDTIRPFDARPHGSVFGEGAGALVAGDGGRASQRNATVLGEVLGGGYAGEAQGLLAIRDDGDGLARAIGEALDDAKLEPGDIGMIVAHGNGTPQSDASEAAAIRTVFGTGADAPPVTAFKWAIGHLIAAAGIIETVIALAALREGVVPGIATLARSRSGLRRHPRLRDAAEAAQQYRADPVPRLRRHQRRADRPRGVAAWCDAAETRRPAGATRCGIDTVEIARIERLLAETAAAETRRASSRRRSSPTAATGAGRARASPRASPRRRRAPSCSRASSRSAQIEPRIFPWRATPTARRRSSAAPRAQALLDRHRIRHRRVADARSHQRVGGRAGAARADRGAATPARLLYRLLPFRRRWFSKTCAACSATRSRRPRSSELAQAHYAHLWRLFVEFLRFRWLSRGRKAALRCASRTSTCSPRRSRAARAC